MVWLQLVRKRLASRDPRARRNSFSLAVVHTCGLIFSTCRSAWAEVCGIWCSCFCNQELELVVDNTTAVVIWDGVCTVSIKIARAGGWTKLRCLEPVVESVCTHSLSWPKAPWVEPSFTSFLCCLPLGGAPGSRKAKNTQREPTGAPVAFWAENLEVLCCSAGWKAPLSHFVNGWLPYGAAVGQERQLCSSS